MSIARDGKKNEGLYGNYMRVLQGMFKKPSGYYGTYMRVLQGMKTISNFWDLYAGIARNEDYQQFLGPICGYCNE